VLKRIGNADLFPPASQLDLTDIVAINRDRCFARAARPYQRDDLTTTGYKADPMKLLCLAIVTEIHLFQTHVSLNWRQWRHPWHILYGVGLVEQREEAFCSSKGNLQLCREPGQGKKGPGEHGKADPAIVSVPFKTAIAASSVWCHTTYSQQSAEGSNGAIGPHSLFVMANWRQASVW
jgi:hypothetical protein